MKKIPSTTFILLTFILFLSSCSAQPNQNQNSNASNNIHDFNAIALSDIHFDPLFDCPEAGECPLFTQLKSAPNGASWDNIFKTSSTSKDSSYGQDTNYALLQNILWNKKNNLYSVVGANHISFGFIVGDFVGHSLKKHYMNLNNQSADGYQDFVKKLMQFISYQLTQYLGSINVIYPVIGNNDSYEDDYNVDSPDSAFYKDTAQSWFQEFPQILQSKFTHLGYYSNYMPDLNLNVIALNSNLFSVKAVSASKDDLDAEAKEQLSWLNDQLQNAKINNQKAMLIFHIPSSINPYDSASKGYAVSLWKQDYQTLFLNIINQYNSEIVGIFNSHTHSDSVYVNSYDSKGHVQSFANLISSISPAHLNNPSFKVIHYSRDNNNNTVLNDIYTYYYDLSIPNSDIALEYQFNSTYSSSNVSNGIDNLISGQGVDSYFQFYNVSTNFVPETNKKYYVCAIKFVTLADYSTCIGK